MEKLVRLQRIKTTIAFTDRQKALDFEAYLKSPSGGRLQKNGFDIPLPDFFKGIERFRKIAGYRCSKGYVLYLN